MAVVEVVNGTTILGCPRAEGSNVWVSALDFQDCAEALVDAEVVPVPDGTATGEGAREGGPREMLRLDMLVDVRSVGVYTLYTCAGRCAIPVCVCVCVYVVGWVGAWVGGLGLKADLSCWSCAR